MARWKFFADWAKQKPAMLRLADRLGRNRGRLAVLDRLAPPPRSPRRPDLSRFLSSELAAIWIGHATMLLRIGGKTVLTDPVMSARVGLGLAVMTAGPRRRFAPALDVHELPPIDLMLVSHAHFDHLDIPTLSKLSKRIPVITATHNADLLHDLGYRDVRELNWGDSADAGPLRVTAVPVAHWGARTFLDNHRGYCAFTIESIADNRRILFGADSAYQDEWKKLAPVDLAVVGIGGYDPYLRGHANPEQAWQMANFVQAKTIAPMHHSTFKLSYEPWEDPMKRFLAAAAEQESRVVIREIGGQWGT